MIKYCVVGYGAMGKTLCDILKENVSFVVAEEVKTPDFSTAKGDFDVIIDFSHSRNLDMIYEYAKKNHIPVVFGTTGFDENDENKIMKLSKVVPVFKSENFSRFIFLMQRAVREISLALGENVDVEVREVHHNKKVDSPSGTAKMLLKTIGQPVKNICSVRAGSVVGEHEVSFYGEDEVLTVHHNAQSKRIFALGAIDAANWLVSQKCGLYGMSDLIKTDDWRENEKD